MNMADVSHTHIDIDIDIYGCICEGLAIRTLNIILKVHKTISLNINSKKI